MLPDVMQTQSHAQAGLCRNGAVLLPGGPGEDSKVRQAIRRSYQRDYLLRALSGRRDIHPIRSHVVPTGTDTAPRYHHAGSWDDKAAASRPFGYFYE